MKISIILPFKNASPWVKETIHSIQEQSYQDWELICINDFSDDQSESVIRQIEDARIKVFRNSSQGIIPALQLGLSKAKGEFVTRMDADDIMPGGRLQLMIETLQASPPKTVVTGKVQYFSQAEVSEGYRKYQGWLNTRIDRGDHYKHIYRECVIASPNWMIRKNDLINDKIFEQLKYPEDYDMVFQWYQHGYKIHPLSETTLLWREHPLRTSRNSDIYDQASFFKLKLNWFFQIENLPTSVAIIGAGQKGKLTKAFLDEQNVPFQMYDMQHQKYDSSVLSPELIHEEVAFVCVYPEKLDALEKFLAKKGYSIGKNAWYL